ncbi:MAG: hypothetical protein ACRDH8_09295 [Actinomycetota bacterium]
MRARTNRLLVIAVLLAACSGPPPTVDRITVANPTEYDLDTEVTGGDRQGWLPLSVVEAGTEVVVRDVIDQGEEWIFRFRHWDESVGELPVAREELERSGWRVEVPEEIGERLQQLGTPPSEGSSQEVV